MALRILQFGIVFAIGFYLGHASPFAGDIAVIPLSIHLEDPKDVTANKGQSATLRCEVKSLSPGLQITWLHNDIPISNDTRRWVQQDGSLYFPKVNGGKRGNGLTGEYRCRANNSVGIVLSNSAKLKTASFDREFRVEPSNLTVSESQPAVFFCGINSVPAAQIMWERNEIPLPHNSRYVPLPKGALLITETHSSDKGSYRCIARNSLLKKNKHSKIVQLTVTSSLMKPVAPTFLPLDILPNATVLVGENINLYCAVTGWPIPTVQWLNNDSIVISNSTILQLHNVTLQNTGNYTCSTYNTEGRKFQKYSVQVQQKPYFNITPTSKTYPSARTVRLDCQAKGTPEPKIHWLKNGKPLNITGRIKKQPSGLVFSHSFTHDSGIYQCVAVNSVGSVWAAAQLVLSLTDFPSPPRDLQCRSFDDSSICLSWRTPENVSVQAYSIYSFYKVTGPETSGTEVSGPEYITNVSNFLAYNLKPSTNYTFYVRLYSKSASDDSEKVTCQTGATGSRNLQILLINETSVQLNWSKLSTDLPCNSSRESYKVQWKRKSRTSVNFSQSEGFSHIISGLTPSFEYEFRVIPFDAKNDESSWTSFVLPESEDSTLKSSFIDESANSTKVVPNVPEQLEASPMSPTVINLIWVNSNENTQFYMICYVGVKEEKESRCEDALIKSVTNNILITNLQPDTLYKFQVKACTSDGDSAYSQPIEIRTPADVPSPVLDLKYNIVNETTACLRWLAPAYKNGKLTRYLISYTPDHNWPLDQWIRKTVPATQRKLKGCSLDNEQSISALLVNLNPDTQYTVLVRAESEVGPGQPIKPIIVTTKNQIAEVNTELDSNETDSNHKKMGIIMGVSIVCICCLLCASCVVVRRRCLKRRAMLRTDSHNYFPAVVAHYASAGSSVQVRLEDPCEADSQEVEELVPGYTPYIPLEARHLDTKGNDGFPNGHINGSAKPFLNGYATMTDDMHITENPRYYVHECNGHAGKNPKHDYEEDSNSNLKTSKFQDLQRIFENSKLDKHPNMTKHKSNSQCNPHLKNSKSKLEDPPKHNSSFNSLSSSEDGSLNSTQLTCLDNSFIMSVNNHRRVSPILGPNG